MNEIEKYSSLSFHPIHDGHCDVVVEKPTYFMKLDASMRLKILNLSLQACV